MLDTNGMIMNEDRQKESIYRSPIFEQVMNEYFDPYDDKTRKELLSLNEAGQETVLQHLANKLYGFIVTKVYNIDFGKIPDSRGDITKIPNYNMMKDCLEILKQILEAYKQKTDSVDTINDALQNMIDRKELFMRAYRMNVELPIITYNTLALSIVNAISLLITAHIEFIKLPNDKGYNIAFDSASKNKTQNSLLFNNLKEFNKMCQNKEFDKIIKYSLHGAAEETIMKKNPTIKEEYTVEPQNEAVISIGTLLTTAGNYLATGGIAAAKTIAAGVGYVTGAITAHPIIAGIIGIFAGFLALIKIIRGLIYRFYYYRTKASDWFETYSVLIYMNSLNTQSALSKDDAQKEKWRSLQEKTAKWFKVIADKIRVDESTAEKNATADIKKMDETKFTLDDITNNGNSYDANQSGSLF